MTSTLDLYATWVDIPTLLLVLTAMSAFVTVLVLWNAIAPPDAVQERINALSGRRVARAAASRPPGAGTRRALAYLVSRFQLVRTGQTERMRVRLLRAGHQARSGLIVYQLSKGAMPLAFAVLAAVLIVGLDLWQVPPQLKPLSVVLAAALGLYVPDLYLANAAKKRERAILKALPDGLDLLVICAEAGLSLDAALKRVATELAPSSPELAWELATTAGELSFLPERRQALVNLVRRCDIAPVRGVVNTLQQTEKYGTPLAHSLRVLSAEFREQRMLRAEEKAARLPAILTVPMIVFILPTLFVVLAGPAMLTVYDSLLKP